jgi:hypothetical protein
MDAPVYWPVYFADGGGGWQSDTGTVHEILRRRRSAGARDLTPNEQIDSLRAEVVHLKAFVGALCQLMIEKGLVDDQDVTRIAEAVYAPPPASEDDLGAIARAVRDQGP